MPLKTIEERVFQPLGLEYSNAEEDQESKEYSGFSFTLNHLKIKFRISKITPTKTGQFVTIWKRNEKGETIPFEISDNIDFYLVAAFKEDLSGIFIFPKKLLLEKEILSNGKKMGKRGIRVYPSWDETKSKQAQKTQEWQTRYFIDLSQNNDKIQQQAKLLLRV
ncbi:MepB family protein [Chryseobacterium sp. M5A1_1a]